jgi:hypothetical protein
MVPVIVPQTKIRSALAGAEDQGQHASVDRSTIGTAGTTGHAEFSVLGFALWACIESAW